MKLYYRKYGSGPPLVILHGLYGSSDNWASIASKLSSHFTVILPDIRNHGQSPHSPVHSYEAIADDLNELTNDLETGKFILGGHSMGGKAAMNFALRWPEKLIGLVIIDISPYGSADPHNAFYNEHKAILEAILSVKPESAGSRGEVENRLAKHILSEKTRSFIMKNLRRIPQGNFEWKLNASDLLSNLSKITEGVISRDDKSTVVTGFPVIFVRGGDSDYIKDEDIIWIRKTFPAADILTIKGTGHWVHAEKPDEIEGIFLKLVYGI